MEKEKDLNLIFIRSVAMYKSKLFLEQRKVTTNYSYKETTICKKITSKNTRGNDEGSGFQRYQFVANSQVGLGRIG